MANNHKQAKGIVTCLIGNGVELKGDLLITGNLHVDGVLTGSIKVRPGDNGYLTLSNSGIIEGDVHINGADINGRVDGNIHADGMLTLHPECRISGDVYYHGIEIKKGAHINGKLISLHNTPQATGNAVLHDSGAAAKA
jgi:cytoskeletal protein CcmA (bactofilin family)